MPPPSPDLSHATPADFAACRAFLRDGSRTFHAASYLLPRKVREPACALYAFCRVADDAVDADGRADDAVARLQERLDRIYAGRPLAMAPDRAFADVVARFAIPHALPAALLEGFTWDMQRRRYDDLAALQAYAARVAGTVGAMMAMLMEVDAPDAVARACDLGVAMQMSNIARDVGEDARCGRLYLPLAWLREAGIDPDAWLARPEPTAAMAAVTRRLLAAADELYARAEGGIAQLPFACRPGIHAARVLYAEIGRAVERGGRVALARRTVVPDSRKLRLLAAALVAAAALRPRDAAAPLPAAAFLVDAVTGAAARRRGAAVAPARTPWWDLGRRIARTLELFERLEQREARGPRPVTDDAWT
jgi:phytoene synthase